MRFSTIGASLLAAVAALLSAPTFAADNQAGTPLDPAEAAGSWTIETGGHSVCTLTLGPDKSVKMASSCGSVLPATPVNWAPTAHGMNLLAANGQTVIGFGRWSNSLLVAHRSSGAGRAGVPAGLLGSDLGEPGTPRRSWMSAPLER